MKELMLLIAGIIAIWLSAELLIRASQIIAHKLGISDTFIGLTILSIGTTLPELGTHIASSIKILQGVDVSEIALGANIGSNIFQMTVILGVVALCIKVFAEKRFLHEDYMVMLGSIILLFIFSLDGRITRYEGAILAASYILYLFCLGKEEHFFHKIEHEHHKHHAWLYIGIAEIIVGTALLYFFANIIVDNAQLLTEQWQVSGSLIGTLILGFGTALPELAAAIVALQRKSSGMSVGVLVGSNITNPLFGVGIGAAISTYTVSSRILYFDLVAWFVLSIIALSFFWSKLKIEKKEGIYLIIAYLVYAYVRLVYVR